MNIYSLNPEPPYVYPNTFTDTQYKIANVYVPEGSLTKYQEADGWKEFVNLQECTPSGIKNTKTDINMTNKVYYDIQGHNLSFPKRGINIINGKKVLIKK